MGLTANPYNGETVLTFTDHDEILRLSNDACVRLEKEAGVTLPMLAEISIRGINAESIEHVLAILWAGMLGNGHTRTLDDARVLLTPMNCLYLAATAQDLVSNSFRPPAPYPSAEKNAGAGDAPAES